MLEKIKQYDQNRLDKKLYPTLVIGSGIAGLYTALKIAQTGVKIALLTKAKLGESNSRYAQGGLAVVLPENTNDSIDLHVKDTLSAGAGLSDPDVTRFISENGARVISDLINCGVPFDKGENNELAMTLEGAHSVRRVLHSGGDATGKNIEETLVDLIKKYDNIDIYERYQVVDLLLDQNESCKGVIAFDAESNSHKVFISQSTVLATGGLCQVYQNTTNPHIATGDGVAIAYRAGADIQDMEFIQFHPTAFHIDSTPRFLISEAVRGEGARLRNIHGELFAHKYHEKADLAPRDIVSRAIYTEMKVTESDHVYLDTTQIDQDILEKRFPNIMNVCKTLGIDIKKDYIPVSPAAHYSMGGIKANVYGQTTIQNLYAVGEACCTSLHGANRLASNSLLECVVIAEQVAHDIACKNEDKDINTNLVELFADPSINNIMDVYSIKHDQSQIDIKTIKDKINCLKKVMWFNTGIIRKAETMEASLNCLNNIWNSTNEPKAYSSVEEYELRNLMLVAKLIVKSAIKRLESRGSHYREDYPLVSNEAVHSYINKKEEENNYEFSTSQINSEQLCSICS